LNIKEKEKEKKRHKTINYQNLIKVT